MGASRRIPSGPAGDTVYDPIGFRPLPVSVHTIQGPAGIVAGAGLEPATTGSMKPVSCHCYTRRADRAGVEPAEHGHGFHAASHGVPSHAPPIATCLSALARPYPCQCCPHSMGHQLTWPTPFPQLGTSCKEVRTTAAPTPAARCVSPVPRRSGCPPCEGLLRSSSRRSHA
jgi:hypothetical protein